MFESSFELNLTLLFCSNALLFFCGRVKSIYFRKHNEKYKAVVLVTIVLLVWQFPCLATMEPVIYCQIASVNGKLGGKIKITPSILQSGSVH